MDDESNPLPPGPIDLFEQYEKPQPLVITSAPSSGTLSDIGAAARELTLTTFAIERAEQLLERLQKRHNHLSRDVLPAMLDAAQTDTVGLPESGLDLTIDVKYKAAIPAAWSQDQQQAAYDHLDALGASNIIKATVVVEFDRDDYHRAQQLVPAINKWLERANVSAITRLSSTVHWATLTSWFKDHLLNPPKNTGNNSVQLNMQLIGAEAYRFAKIVKRKTEKPKRNKRK